MGWGKHGTVKCGCTHRRRGQPRVLALGTFQPDYPRNQLTQAALQAGGCIVETLAAPVWDRLEDRLAPLRDWRALLRFGLRLVRAYLGLLARLPGPLSRADLVLIGYPGHLDMLFFGALARLTRRRLVFDPLVTLTDTLVEDRGLVSPGSARARFIRAVDQVALRLADVVLADTEENAAFMQALAPGTRARFVVVPVGADERVFSPESGTASAISWPEHDPGALRVLFYGTFIPLHGPETIVRAAALLGVRSASVVMVGQGQLWSQTRALAVHLGTRNVTFVPWVPYPELPVWIAQADVVLGIFGDTPKAARVVPNKVYQAMAMGAALVTRDSPPVRRLLEHGRSALLVPPADPAALARAVEALGDADVRRRLGQAARHTFLRVARADVVAVQLAEALSPALRPSQMGEPHEGARR